MLNKASQSKKYNWHLSDLFDVLQKMPWYTMTAIYLWNEEENSIRKYERRTTICKASDKEDATERLLRESKDYPIDGIEFLGEYCIQEIDDPMGDEPVEVAHEMSLGMDPITGQTITPDEFLRTKWGCARIEDCEIFGIKHSWYNYDGERSSCYNCRVIRVGRLWQNSEPTNK